jgi:hypothetical protein
MQAARGIPATPASWGVTHQEATMATGIDELVVQMREIQSQIESAYDQKREDISFVVERGRIRFAEAVMQQQRLRRIGVFQFIRSASLLSIVTAPVIYAGFIPLAFLDLFCLIYQAVCFPAYHIPKVKRSEYLSFDRGDLPYLNPIQKFNCFYCSYANGLAAYFREIAARTEQYHCPIKHARKMREAHDRYPKFFEFGDAESYRLGLEKLQRELHEIDAQ